MILATGLFAMGLVVALPDEDTVSGFSVDRFEGAVEARPKKEAWRPVLRGERLGAGTQIRTGAKARLDLALVDGSRVRVGSSARLRIERARLRQGERSVELRLFEGQVWAGVRKTAGPSTFEVRTAHAVAGARGTAFSVLARADLSAVVRVYAGSVGVRGHGGRPAAAGRSRRRIEGPQRVSRAQWEEVVARAMTEVRVSAVGEIEPAEIFEDEGEAQLWAEWHRARGVGSP